MSKQGATSANMKPCNCANAELHCKEERREKLDYVRHDLTSQNVSWHRYDDKPLTQCFDDACKLYTEATGQKPQLGKVFRFDKKTNRKREIEGFAPIREMVVVIKPETSEKDIDKLCKEMQKRFGMTPLAFSIHRDEGHWAQVVDERTGSISKEWKPNLHAHLFFDVMERRLKDHKGKEIPEKKRGRTIKFTEVQTRMMQDVTAKVLGMERGEIGSKRTHEDQIEYKRTVQAQELSEAITRTNEKKAEFERLSGQAEALTAQVEEKQQALSDIDAEIEGKTPAVERLKSAGDWLTGKSRKRAKEAEAREAATKADAEKKIAEIKAAAVKVVNAANAKVEEANNAINAANEHKRQNQVKLDQYDAMERRALTAENKVREIENTRAWQERMIEKFVEYGAVLRDQWNKLFKGESVESSHIRLNGVQVPLDNPIKLRLNKGTDFEIHDQHWVTEQGFWYGIKRGLTNTFERGSQAYNWVIQQLGGGRGMRL